MSNNYLHQIQENVTYADTAPEYKTRHKATVSGQPTRSRAKAVPENNAEFDDQPVTSVQTSLLFGDSAYAMEPTKVISRRGPQAPPDSNDVQTISTTVTEIISGSYLSDLSVGTYRNFDLMTVVYDTFSRYDPNSSSASFFSDLTYVPSESLTLYISPSILSSGGSLSPPITTQARLTDLDDPTTHFLVADRYHPALTCTEDILIRYINLNFADGSFCPSFIPGLYSTALATSRTIVLLPVWLGPLIRHHEPLYHPTLSEGDLISACACFFPPYPSRTDGSSFTDTPLSSSNTALLIWTSSSAPNTPTPPSIATLPSITTNTVQPTIRSTDTFSHPLPVSNVLAPQEDATSGSTRLVPLFVILPLAIISGVLLLICMCLVIFFRGVVPFKPDPVHLLAKNGYQTEMGGAFIAQNFNLSEEENALLRFW